MRKFLSLFAVVLIAICVSVSKTEAQAGRAHGLARITITPHGLPIVTVVDIRVNGYHVADLRYNQSYSGTVAPGKVVISMQERGKWFSKSFTFTAEANKSYGFFAYRPLILICSVVKVLLQRSVYRWEEQHDPEWPKAVARCKAEGAL